MKFIKNNQDTAEVAELNKKLKVAKAREKWVSYLSPGTFFAEENDFKIDGELDFGALVKKAKTIEQRHGAKPFGFKVKDGNGNSLTGIFYITGEVKTYDEVPDVEANRILRDNMNFNGHPLIIENKNSYRFTSFFNENDVVLDWEGNVVRRGNDPDLMKYRKEFEQKRNQ